MKLFLDKRRTKVLRTVGLFLFGWCLFVTVLQIHVITVDAAGKNAKAKSAYHTLLKKEKYKNDSFCLVDIDQNGIDELVLSSDDMMSFYEMFTYKNGKVHKIGYSKDYLSSRYGKEGVIGYYPAYCAKRKEFYAEAGGGTVTIGAVFNLENVKLIKKHDLYWYHEDCSFDGKKMSVKEMEKLFKRYDKALKGIKNTAKNRQLYLNNKKEISMVEGHHKKIGLSAQYAKSIIYRSSNKSVATVDKKGKIAAKKPGSTRISCTVRYYGHTENYVISVIVRKSKNSYGIKGLDYEGDMVLLVDKLYKKNKRYYISGELMSINYDDLASGGKTLKKTITFKIEDSTEIYVWIRKGDADFKMKKVTINTLAKGTKDDWVFPDVRSMPWDVVVKNGKLVSMGQVWP